MELINRFSNLEKILKEGFKTMAKIGLSSLVATVGITGALYALYQYGYITTKKLVEKEFKNVSIESSSNLPALIEQEIGIRIFSASKEKREFSKKPAFKDLIKKSFREYNEKIKQEQEKNCLNLSFTIAVDDEFAVNYLNKEEDQFTFNNVVLDSISKTLKDTSDKLNQEIKLDKYERINFSVKKFVYWETNNKINNSISLFNNLRKELIKDDADYVIGLTGINMGVYEENKWESIRGQGEPSGRFSLVKHVSGENSWEESSQVILHELGHNLGLVHTETTDDLMCSRRNPKSKSICQYSFKINNQKDRLITNLQNKY